MPRNLGITVENNFVRGLVTEATGLNFPENACIDTDNCVFDSTGEVYRRPGIEFESNHSIFASTLDDVAISEYVWRGAAKNGEITFFVIQIGDVVSFFRADIEGSVSGNEEAFFVYLPTYAAPGAPNLADMECSFASGNGCLFIAHPRCDPVVVEYNEDTHNITIERVQIDIRDLKGVPNYLADGTIARVDYRPTVEELTPYIRYNLDNQGWYGSRWTSANRQTVVYNDLIEYFRVAIGVLPAETEIPWHYNTPLVPIVNEDGNILQNIPTEAISEFEFKENSQFGTTPAPKGHYLLSAFYQDRAGWVEDAAGLPIVTSGYQRPSQIAFYAGRVFYAGVQSTGYNTKIYFSQILDGKIGVGKCYQQQDPTAESGGDLLPSDGGVIEIPDVAKIVKLMQIGSAILIFATNGVWSLSGSEGVGFTATDYNVTRLSSIGAISSTSFVDVNGAPLWWNYDGIYTIKQSAASAPSVESVSNSTIQSFYDDIPSASKRYAKAAYNPMTRIVQWIYRSETEEGLSDRYEYDRILNLDVNTGAFYPWSLPDECVKIAGITVLLGQGVSFEDEDVTVEGVTVTVEGEDVTAQDIVRNELTNVFKYLTVSVCDIEEVEEPEVGEVVELQAEFKGHVTDTAVGIGAQLAHQNGFLFGDDGKIYIPTVPTDHSVNSLTLMRFDGTDEDTVTLSLANLVSDINSGMGWGLTTAFPYVSSSTVFTVAVPFSPYVFVALGCSPDALASLPSGVYSAWALYKINAAGALVFQSVMAFEGGAFNLNYSATIRPHSADYIGAILADYKASPIGVLVSNTSSIIQTGSSVGVLELPSINTFIASNGSDDLEWQDIVNDHIVEDYRFLLTIGSSYQTDDTGNYATAFFLPSGATSILCKYVSHAQAKWHIDNPGAPAASATIASFAGSYPNGFVIGKFLTGGGWFVMNGNFRDTGGSAIIPFADLGDNRDGSAGDPYFNDWHNPTVQHNRGSGYSYVIWTRRYENIALNQTSLGSYGQVLIQRWNTSTNIATTLGDNENNLYDTVAEGIASSELTRYGQFPVTSLAFMDSSFNIYMYIHSDTSQGSTGYEHVVAQFGVLNEPTVTVSEAGLTFSEFTNLNYLDWEQATGGVDFDSYFIPGFKVRGEAIRKFQSNYVRLYTRHIVPSTFDFNSRWDFANASGTGRWSNVQRVVMEDSDHDYMSKRLKIRGHGLACTFKVKSVTSQPFNIIGWSVYESSNNTP